MTERKMEKEILGKLHEVIKKEDIVKFKILESCGDPYLDLFVISIVGKGVYKVRRLGKYETLSAFKYSNLLVAGSEAYVVLNKEKI